MTKRQSKTCRTASLAGGLLGQATPLRRDRRQVQSSGWLDLHVADMQTTAGRPRAPRGAAEAAARRPRPRRGIAGKHQELLRACVAERRFRPDGEPEPWLPDFRAFAASVLGWSFSPKGYAGTAESPIPPDLETPLQEGGEVLRPPSRCASATPATTGRGGNCWSR